MTLHISEIQRQCEVSMARSRHRRATARINKETNRELIGILAIVLCAVALFAILAALEGFGVW